MGVDCCRQQDSCCKPVTTKKTKDAKCCESDNETSSGGCQYNKPSLTNPLVAVGLVAVAVAAAWFLSARRVSVATA